MPQPSSHDYRTLMTNALVKIEKMQAKIDAYEQAKSEPVAIIGMACRLPGGVNTPDLFWQKLLAGYDGITDIPTNRWDVDAYYDPDPDAAGKMYTKKGGFLTDIDGFDAAFFGISPREASQMDPQQRLVLEVAWEALEDAGIIPARLMNSPTGVFVGMMNYDYTRLNSSHIQNIDLHTGTGFCGSVNAGRLSYTLGLQGPSMMIDTACSSSLVAAHQACQSLRLGESDLAIAGGVNLILSPHVYITECRANMLSADGYCKTFDASANGYSRGEGCGMVILKRLSDARRDGDPVVAVIRGSAINQDGRSSGITVPNGPAQEAVIKQALGHIDPARIGYIETHGTGTPLGDPIEIEALAHVFGASHQPQSPLMVGAVKSNIGHLEGAAGVTGLIKLALCLKHGMLPPSIHFEKPNPKIDWSTLPIQVVIEPKPWEQAQSSRMGGVSSFGFCGINCHMVLEAVAPQAPMQSVSNRPYQLLTLSAETRSSLSHLIKQYQQLDQIQSSLPEQSQHLSDLRLADLCYTANCHRTHFQQRQAFAVASSDDLMQQLKAWKNGSSTALELPLKIAFLFTGQGAQYLNMARQLYETEPYFENIINHCNEVLSGQLNPSLIGVLYNHNEQPENAPDIHQTAYTQPAMFAIEVALAKLWQFYGVMPTLVMGHSLGEYAAACIAGVFSLEDGLKMVAARGRLMQALPKNGKMLAIAKDALFTETLIASFPGDITIAACNGPTNTVISGDAKCMNEIAQELAKQQIKTATLKVSHAFHSQLMEPMLDEYKSIVNTVTFQQPEISIINNVDGNADGSVIANADYWLKQIVNPVLFQQGVSILSDQGINCCLEIGPTPVLLGMAQLCLASDAMLWLPSLHKEKSDSQVMLSSLATLYGHGIDIQWDHYYQFENHRRINVPFYPWDSQSYWVTTTDQIRLYTEPYMNDLTKVHPLLGNQIDSPLETRQFESILSGNGLEYLKDHQVNSAVILPAAAFIEMIISAIQQKNHEKTLTLKALEIKAPLFITDKASKLLTIVSSRQVIIYSRLDGNAGWQEHVDVTIAVHQQRPEMFDLETVRQQCQHKIDLHVFYQQLARQGLIYGANFQGLSALSFKDHQLLAKIELPERLTADEHYYIHPVLLDSAFHSLACLIYHSSSKYAYLPIGVDEISTYGRCHTTNYCIAQLTDDGDELKRANITIVNPLGECVLKCEGLRLQKVNLQHFLPHPAIDQQQWCYQWTWPEQPVNECQQSKEQIWVSLSMDNNTNHGLVKSLVAGGNINVKVSVAGYFQTLPGNHFIIAADKPDDYARLWMTLGQRYPGKTFNLICHWSDTKTIDDSATLMNLQQTTCGRVLALVQSLAARKIAFNTKLWLITSGAVAEKLDPDQVRPWLSSLWGMGRTIQLEMPDLQCKLIDMDPAQPIIATDYFYYEAAQSSENQVIYRHDQRYVGRLTHYNNASLPILDIDDEGCYLITGGLGALGQLCASWLIEKGAHHLYLIGRSAAEGQAKQNIEQWQQQGVQVNVIQGDIAQYSDAEHIFSLIKAQTVPLKGLIHCAGILDDGVIDQQSWSRYESVMQPKVMGSWHLHQMTRHLNLSHFILFSSAASMLGSTGQSNYAAANAFMDALAYYRHGKGLPACCINWGPWQSGMAADISHQDRQRFQQFGINVLADKDNLAMLAVMMSSSLINGGVFSVNWRQYAEKITGSQVPAVLSQLITQQDQDKCLLSILVQLNQAAVNEKRVLLLNHVRQVTADVLGLTSADKVAVDKGFFETGMDSLTALELKNRLQKSLQTTLLSTLAFSYPTVTELADYLMTTLAFDQEDVAEDIPASMSEIMETTLSDDEAIEQMTEAELAALVDNKLNALLEDEV